MADCTQFTEGSRRRTICDGTAGLPEDKINAYRIAWGLEPLTVFPDVVRVKAVNHSGTAPLPRQGTKAGTRKGCATCGGKKKKAAPPSVGAGTELLLVYAAAGVPSCQGCKDTAAKMDKWGTAESRRRIDEITEEILPRAKKWIENNKPWVHALLPNCIEDVALRLKIAHDVAAAITTAEDKERTSLMKRSGRRRGRQGTPAGGRGRGRGHGKALANTPAIPTDPIPFTDTPRLSLMFHVWPFGNGWRRHIEKLAPVLDRFDRKLLGIAVDSSTASAAEVAAAFGPGWEIVEAVNNPAKRKGLREVATYQQMLPTLSGGINDVTLCAHAKGVQTHTAASEPVTWWTDAMYETILYNIDGVIDAMSDGASIVGSFRRHGKQLGTKYRWHFSGTYYAFRNAIAFSNGVPSYKQKWWGTESWPGDHFPLSSSHCIFGDGINDLYRPGQQPRAEFEAWRGRNANSAG